MDMSRRFGVEFFSTFWLVFGGCGAAVLAASFPTLGIGFLGVAFAFGLTLLTMAYGVGRRTSTTRTSDFPNVTTNEQHMKTIMVSELSIKEK
jgi:glycerol uptake facilitator-like aquaporin